MKKNMRTIKEMLSNKEATKLVAVEREALATINHGEEFSKVSATWVLENFKIEGRKDLNSGHGRYMIAGYFLRMLKDLQDFARYEQLVAA